MTKKEQEMKYFLEDFKLLVDDYESNWGLKIDEMLKLIIDKYNYKG
jgi:hypothetical protein